MYIPPTGLAPAPAATTSSQAKAVLSSDFETFLQMLTAQAKFQDPLEPIDSSEYAAQLAQFSMVEQQVQSNDLLTALTAQMGAGNMAQMSGWIGMEARTTAPVQFDGDPVTVVSKPAAVSDQVFLLVYDSNGQVVQRREIPVSAEPVQWVGRKDDGTAFPAGSYSFGVESRANGEVILNEAAFSYGRITEARLQNNETVLILEGGSAVQASDVTGLREPV